MLAFVCRWLLYAVVAPDEYGEAVPIAYMITSHEGSEPVITFLNTLKGACPELAPRVIVIDKSDAEILAIRECDLSSAEIRLCFFHIMQAWQRWLKRSDNGVKQVRS